MSPVTHNATVGGRTLEVFEGTPRVNRWVYSRFADLVRGDVLEVGSGIGNISRLLVRDAATAVLTDVEPEYLERLRHELSRPPAVRVCPYELGTKPPRAVAERRYDAIVAINVIEHVADDARAVADLTDLLRPGGHLLAYVPAMPFAFGSLDEALGHYRRYTARSFADLLRDAGLEPGPVRHMNLPGLPAWFLNGRVLRRRALNARQVQWFERLMPLIRLEDHFRPPIGLGVFARARKPA